MGGGELEQAQQARGLGGGGRRQEWEEKGQEKRKQLVLRTRHGLRRLLQHCLQLLSRENGGNMRQIRLQQRRVVHSHQRGDHVLGGLGGRDVGHGA